MANYANSLLVAGQAMVAEQFKKQEWRASDNATLMVMDYTAKSNPEAASLREREDRAVNLYLPVRTAQGTSTSRAPRHTGPNGQSQAVPLSWNTFTENFSVSIKQGQNNIFNTAQQYAYNIVDRTLSLVDRIDSWALGQIIANRTQYVAVAGGNTTGDATNDRYTVGAAEQNYFFQNIRTNMRRNRYKGQLMGVVDHTMYQLAERLMEQGSANNTNFGFQFQGMEVGMSTRDITLGATAGVVGSGLFWEAGAVGLIPWIDPKNRERWGDNPDSYNGIFDTMQLDGLPFPVQVSIYSDRADTSADNGSTQDVRMFVELSVDVAFFDAPMSDFRGENESPIYGYSQLNA